MRISGKLKLRFDFAYITPRKNGKCDLAQNAKPVAEDDMVLASGTVSFS